jgi:hypothetical protein
VGASRPASLAARSSRSLAVGLDLDVLDARFACSRDPTTAASRADRSFARVVVLMGIAGAGKSRLAESCVARGYERLNRDTLGGTLKGSRSARRTPRGGVARRA